MKKTIKKIMLLSFCFAVNLLVFNLNLKVTALSAQPKNAQTLVKKKHKSHPPFNKSKLLNHILNKDKTKYNLPELTKSEKENISFIPTSTFLTQKQEKPIFTKNPFKWIIFFLIILFVSVTIISNIKIPKGFEPCSGRFRGAKHRKIKKQNH